MVAFIQLAIGLGSTVGGLMFDQYGYQTAFATSAGLLIAGALLVIALHLHESRSAQPSPAAD